jgi:transposase
MAKYSDQQRLEAARDYCDGDLGLREVARRHGVHVDSLRLWAAAYRVHGATGTVTKPRQFYAAKFKWTVLQRMQTERLSRRQAAALFNIRRHDIIKHWQLAYKFGGVAALQPHAGARLMAKKPNRALESEKLSDEKRNRKQLLEELQHLRMENA